MATTKTKARAKTKTGTKEKKPDIRKQIKHLLETIEQSWFEISVLLSNAYYGELYKQWGYNSFEDYAKAELNMEYRSAMFRVQVGKTINELGITKEQVAEMGWTKFKELTYVLKEDQLDKEGVQALIDSVKDLSYRETQDFIKQVRLEQQGEGSENKIKKSTLKFKLNQEQEEVVTAALSEAGEIIGDSNEGLALEYICLEWQMNHSKEPIVEIEEEPEEVKPKRKERADKQKQKKKKK